MVVVSTVMVNSSVTVFVLMTMARLARGVADTRARKEERAIMLVDLMLTDATPWSGGRRIPLNAVERFSG